MVCMKSFLCEVNNRFLSLVNPKFYKSEFSQGDYVNVFSSLSKPNINNTERSGVINFINEYEVSIVLEKDIINTEIMYSIFKLYSDTYQNIFRALTKLQAL
jgi:hypothetical protein